MRVAESLLAFQRGDETPEATAGALHIASAMHELRGVREILEGIVRGLARR